MRQQIDLGRDAGQPRLSAGGPAPVLGSGREVLPELESVADAPRPMWRHPAFIVSSILALLALIAAVVLTLISVLGSGGGEVKQLSIDVSSGNAHLSWSASGPVELFSVTNGEALDLTQLISGENEAWVPAALDLYSQSSCFVVRPAGGDVQQVSLDGDVLAEQRAASACVRDGDAG